MAFATNQGSFPSENYSHLHNRLQRHFEKYCLYLASDVTAKNAEVTLAFICQQLEQSSNGDHCQKHVSHSSWS